MHELVEIVNGRKGGKGARSREDRKEGKDRAVDERSFVTVFYHSSGGGSLHVTHLNFDVWSGPGFHVCECACVRAFLPHVQQRSTLQA